jgi:hypothetical protein
LIDIDAKLSKTGLAARGFGIVANADVTCAWLLAVE